MENAENKSKRLEFWEQPEQLSLIRFYARRYNSLKYIAKDMCIDRVTLWRWQRESPLIREALINNRWVRVAEVEDLLYEKAKEGKIWAMNRYLKAFGGKSYGPRMPTYFGDDCEIGLISEVVSESPPAEDEPKKKLSENPDEVPGLIKKIVYKYSTE